MFFDYSKSLEEFIDSKDNSKFALMITNEQVAMITGKTVHEELIRNLYSTINLGNSGRFIDIEEENIVGFGYKDYAIFFLPRNVLTDVQYKAFEEIINTIDEKNNIGNSFHYEIAGVGNIDVIFDSYKDNKSNLFNSIKKYVTPISNDYEMKEKIVGKPHIVSIKTK